MHEAREEDVDDYQVEAGSNYLPPFKMPKNRSREIKDVHEMYSALDNLEEKLKDLSGERNLPKALQKFDSQSTISLDVNEHN